MVSFSIIALLATAFSTGVIATGGSPPDINRLNVSPNRPVPESKASGTPRTFKRPIERERPSRLIIPTLLPPKKRPASTEPMMEDEALESSSRPTKRPRPEVVSDDISSDSPISPGKALWSEDPEVPPAPRGARHGPTPPFRGNIPDEPSE